MGNGGAISDESAVHENFNLLENSVSSFPNKEVKRARNAHKRRVQQAAVDLYNMTSTSEQTVTEHEYHQLVMLLWQADVLERNGRKHEAFEIRTWVADFRRPQSQENQ